MSDLIPGFFKMCWPKSLSNLKMLVLEAPLAAGFRS